MVVHCEIQYDQNSYATYYSGQLMNGTVILNCDKPKEVKGIQLKISGKAVARWKERRGGRNVVYHGLEDYLASRTYLMGSDEATTNCRIEAGRHSFNFSCQLPHNCPSSYEGTYGYIRYVVKVTLERPWKFDQTYTSAFTVLKLTDLNYESPQLRMPSNSEAYKIFCCGPCKTEPFKIQVHVPQAGYVPGQTIAVNALIINNTNIPVKSTEFVLAMMVRYISNNKIHMRVQKICVSSAPGEPVLRNCTRSISATLAVPATPPTCVHLSGVIQIAYQVEVVATMKGPYPSQVVAVPITIGNVPIRDVSAVVMEQPSTSRNNRSMESAMAEEGKDGEIMTKSEMSVAVTEASGQPATPDSLSNMPLPSYEEATHTERSNINDEELHTFGPLEFAPLYPVYDIPSPVNGGENVGNGNTGFSNSAYEK